MRLLLKTLLSFLLTTVILPSSAKTYLVSVGLADYPGTRNDLRATANDATDIAKLFELNSDCQSVLLLNSQATATNIIKSMKRIFSMAGSNDEVIFFFSGHGVPGAFCVYDGRLPYSHIRDAMAKGQATRKFIIADACFAGDFRTEKKQQYDNSPDKKADVMLFLSSRNNEKSIEKRFSRNGLFTTYLLNGLKGKADKNRNRKIEAKELFNYVWRHVKEDSRDRQHPVMWGRFKDTMPVMSW